MKPIWKALVVATPLAAVLVGLGCKSGTDGGGADPVQAQLKDDLKVTFTQVPGMLDGLDRLLTAAAGGPADGVVLVPNGNIVTGSLAADLDGDGTRETTVSGQAVFIQAGNLDAGATVTASGPNGGNVSADVQTVGGTVEITGINASLGAPGASTQVNVTAGAGTIDPATGNVGGFAYIEVLSGQDPLFATVYFEDDGHGGWRMRVHGDSDSFEFFVP